jgi:hypothetical protein
MVFVVLACGAVGLHFVDRRLVPIEREDRIGELPGPSFPLTPDDETRPATGPIVRAAPHANTREGERSRRAVRPPGDSKRKDRMHYDAVLEGREGGKLLTKPAEPMPPTYCRSVEPAPKHDDPFTGPHRVHDLTVTQFVGESGFGIVRMAVWKNDRGIRVSSQSIDRVELVSLLTDYQPSVYVLDEMATPPLAREAKRRPLDEFERLGLDAVRRGDELVWTREAPTRMFGAIRATADCLKCHANTKEGDLLGAFTYYLNAPVDKLKVRE